MGRHWLIRKKLVQLATFWFLVERGNYYLNLLQPGKRECVNGGWGREREYGGWGTGERGVKVDKYLFKERVLARK